MQLNSQLRRSGHFSWMRNLHLVKLIQYGVLSAGHRDRGGQEKADWKKTTLVSVTSTIADGQLLFKNIKLGVSPLTMLSSPLKAPTVLYIDPWSSRQSEMHLPPVEQPQPRRGRSVNWGLEDNTACYCPEKKLSVNIAIYVSLRLSHTTEILSLSKIKYESYVVIKKCCGSSSLKTV